MNNEILDLKIRNRKCFILCCFSLFLSIIAFVLSLFACFYNSDIDLDNKSHVSINAHSLQTAETTNSLDTFVRYNSNYNINSASAIWTDGVNYYYSNGSTQYQLVNFVGYLKWSNKTWTGLTNFNGQYVWTDGVNYYYSNGSTQYVLNVSTSTWTTKTWTGLTNFNGQYVWTDGVYYYYSVYNALYGTSEQYVLNVSTSTWTTKTWTGLTAFSGSTIWTDGVNYYASFENLLGSSYQSVLDVSTSTWTTKTWTGLTAFSGSDVFSIFGSIFVVRYGYLYYLDGSLPNDYMTYYYSGYNSGYDDGYTVGYNAANDLFNGFGVFLYSTWSVRDASGNIINDFTGRFDVTNFDKYNGGFIIGDNLYNTLVSYFSNNDIQSFFRITFDNPISVSSYSLFMLYNIGFGNSVDLYFTDGTAISFYGAVISSTLDLSSYSGKDINYINITYGSSFADFGHFGLAVNSFVVSSYNSGFNDGFSKGNESGVSSGKLIGYNNGYSKGYEKGVSDSGNYSFSSLLTAVVESPVHVLFDLLDFNVMGFNILSLVLGLLTFGIIILIIKLMLGGK